MLPIWFDKLSSTSLLLFLLQEWLSACSLLRLSFFKRKHPLYVIGLICRQEAHWGFLGMIGDGKLAHLCEMAAGFIKAICLILSSIRYLPHIFIVCLAHLELIFCFDFLSGIYADKGSLSSLFLNFCIPLLRFFQGNLVHRETLLLSLSSLTHLCRLFCFLNRIKSLKLLIFNDWIHLFTFQIRTYH